MDTDIELDRLKNEIIKLTNKLKAREEKHKENIANLLAIQVEYTESIFDNIEKIVFQNEISVMEIKHIPTTNAKWNIRRIRAQYISQLKQSQHMVDSAEV